MHVAIEASLPPSSLEVQGVFGTFTQREASSQNVAPEDTGAAQLDAPHEAQRLTVVLVSTSDEVLDVLHIDREAREPTQAEQLELVERVKADLAAGEGEQIELKPWVRPRDHKESEIVKTIVAFGNTRGGRLYIGAKPTGIPEGRSALHKALPTKNGTAPDEVEQAAREWLREVLQERLRRPPPVEDRVVHVHGEPILCVVVERGSETPYATIENDIFIRKGASNRRPDPHSELPALVGNPSQVVDTSVWSS